MNAPPRQPNSRVIVETFPMATASGFAVGALRRKKKKPLLGAITVVSFFLHSIHTDTHRTAKRMQQLGWIYKNFQDWAVIGCILFTYMMRIALALLEVRLRSQKKYICQRSKDL